MSARAARRLAVAMLAAWMLLTAALIVFSVMDRNADTPAGGDGIGASAGFSLAFVAYPVVGGALAFRRPGNRIGWLFLTVGLLLVAAAVFPAYAIHGIYASPGSLPAVRWAAWVSAWLDPLFILALAFLLLLFPDGAVPTRRWRPVLWLAITVTAATAVESALKPGEIRPELPVQNPLGIEGAAGLFSALDTPGYLAFVGCVVAGVASLVARFVGASAEVRQQIKWIAGAGLLLLLAFATDIVLVGVLNWGHGLPDAVFGVAFAAAPVAAGVAILRYRLYEIDRIISRTLGYAALSVVLAAVYAGLVLAGQALFSSFAGGSHLAIAGSTLVVAALFLPARSRIQRTVDRRFYRHRYDAKRTLEAFATRLREQVELEALTAELRGVVAQTMQPGHVTLWLRPREP